MSKLISSNITINCQSPTFRYSPSRDGPISQGWNLTYSGSDDSKWSQNIEGLGLAYHRTNLSGAYFEFDWTGTAIYVYGNASQNASYQTTVDGTTVQANANLNDSLLASVKELTYGPHTLRVTTENAQLFAVRGAVLTVGMGVQG